MIITHDNDGRITGIVNDPVPQGTAERYRELGIGFVEAEPGRDAIAVSRACWVTGGGVEPRPACPAAVSVEGRTITLSAVPEGSVVTAIVDGLQVSIEDTSIEVDEPGPITIIIAAQWPFLEGRHDLEIK